MSSKFKKPAVSTEPQPEETKKQSKWKRFLFYFGLIAATVVIWAVLYGGLASITTDLLAVSSFIQALNFMLGAGTPMALLYLIHQHRNK